MVEIPGTRSVIRTMSREALVAMVRARFPHLSDTGWTLNTDGLLNDILIYKGERVFRFPRDDRARDLLRREVRLLEVIRSRIELCVPRYDEVFEDFATYRFVPGVPLYRHELCRESAAVQDRVAKQLAELLQQLRTIPLSELRSAGVRVEGGLSTQNWEGLFEEIVEELFPHMRAHARAWAAEHFKPVIDGGLDMAYEPGLVNGDLVPPHLLRCESTRLLTGVIDFGAATIGDQAVDAALLIHHYDEPFLARLVKYERQIDELLERARFIAGALELIWGLFAVRRREPLWSLVHLGSARSVGSHGDPLWSGA